MNAPAAAIQALQVRLNGIDVALDENEDAGQFYHEKSRVYRDEAAALNVERIEMINAILALGGEVAS